MSSPPMASDQGAVTLEFGLLTPFLIVFMMLCVVLGTVGLHMVQLQSLAQHSVMMITTNAATVRQLQNKLPKGVELEVTPGRPKPGDTVSVAIIAPPLPGIDKYIDVTISMQAFGRQQIPIPEYD